MASYTVEIYDFIFWKWYKPHSKFFLFNKLAILGEFAANGTRIA
jgi:hypothetical protein